MQNMDEANKAEILRENFDRLKQEQEFFLVGCAERIQKWQKFKDDYVSLRNRLETLPHQLRHEVTVPISKFGFMQGKLIHTNEILVLLGDNWFVEKSAKQACEVITRRLVSIDKQLEDLAKEKKGFEDQLDWTKNIIEEKGEFVNIEEKLDDIKEEENPVKPKKGLSEEEKKELRRKQQEKARLVQAKIDDELKNPQIGSKLVEKLPSKMADLKLEEPPIKSSAGTSLSFESQLEEEYTKKALHEMATPKSSEANKKGVSWFDTKKEETTTDDDEDGSNGTENSEDEKKTLSDIYDSDDDEAESEIDEPPFQPNVIKFHHTKSAQIDEKERIRKISRDMPVLNTPGDIFNHFSKPKSILKTTAYSHHQEENKENSHEMKNLLTEKFEPLKAFSGEIKERITSKDVEVAVPKEGLTNMGQPEVKRVSKFKSSKQ